HVGEKGLLGQGDGSVHGVRKDGQRAIRQRHREHQGNRRVRPTTGPGIAASCRLKFERRQTMRAARVLVGTRKGAFIRSSDGKRQKWKVEGPLFGGWEIYHVKGSSVDPNRIYASQSSGWFGQVIQRSDDGGKTWQQPGTPPGEPTTTPEGM